MIGMRTGDWDEFVDKVAMKSEHVPTEKTAKIVADYTAILDTESEDKLAKFVD